MTSDPHPVKGEFDGIICFGGEDYWYHNRGHFDMQVMREMSRHLPVLYVNSIGMRVPRPSEGRMFLTRVRRKLRSIRRGVVPIRENFSVMSPIAAPSSLGRMMTGAFMPRQVRRAAASMGITSPLIWIACPPAAKFIDRIEHAGLVYQRTDRFEEFPNVDPVEIGRCDRILKERADLVVFCSRILHQQEGGSCSASVFADHGVDFAAFEMAGTGNSQPSDMQHIARPRAGFIGGIDSHTFDASFFSRVVQLLPDVQFVLVGACSLPEGWCAGPNVHMLGQRPYEAVPDYMAACDVLLMPWNQNEWIKACNPVKFKEYLAVGRPVVSTPFPELDHWPGSVSVAGDPGAFAEAISRSLEVPGDESARRRMVREHGWDRKTASIIDALEASGVLMRSTGRD